jgi:hypothetical protein
MAGRPEFIPTDGQRAQVKAMAAYGVPQDDIAKVVGCSTHTLRKHFWSELEVAAIEANAKVAQSLFRKAVEGNGKEAVTAAIFWLKCRAGWRDMTVEPGKKEQAEAVAMTAERGTDWDQLLN